MLKHLHIRYVNVMSNIFLLYFVYDKFSKFITYVNVSYLNILNINFVLIEIILRRIVKRHIWEVAEGSILKKNIMILVVAWKQKLIKSLY